MKSIIIRHLRLRHWLSEIIIIVLSLNAAAQVNCNQITVEMGYTVRSVKINSRWVSPALKQQVEQIVGLGQPFNPSNITAAEVAVRNEILKNEGQPEFWLLKGSTSILYIYSQSCDVSSDSVQKQVAVEISPYYLRIDLFNLGNNILPVPRSARPSFYNQVPMILKATAPFFTFSSDRQYGPAMGIITNTDLLHLPGNKPKSGKAGLLRVNLNVAGRKSFSEPFYNIGSQLELNHPVYTDSTMGWNLALQWGKSLLPWVTGQNNTDHWNFQAGLQGSANSKLFNKWAVGTGGRFTQISYSFLDGNEQPNYEEKGWQLYALADGRPGKNFTRIGIWFDAAIPDAEDNISNYQRLVSRIGYSQFLGSGHNSVLIETVAGAGYTWGAAPIYSQYVAGNSNYNFIYEPMNSFRNRVMQNGPLLRSLGENEGGLSSMNGSTIGGSSFWHMNLNFSLPIARWAKPLIPDVVISDEEPVSTLRSVLKGQANTTANFIYDDLVNNHGYPDDDATNTTANAIVDKEIRPTLNYLADRANIYSIKPVLLFDIGYLGDHTLQGKTFTAAGLGLQMTIVIARLEIGYMHTLSPDNYNSRGNFFLHFVLQNFY